MYQLPGMVTCQCCMCWLLEYSTAYGIASKDSSMCQLVVRATGWCLAASKCQSACLLFLHAGNFAQFKWLLKKRDIYGVCVCVCSCNSPTVVCWSPSKLFPPPKRAQSLQTWINGKDWYHSQSNLGLLGCELSILTTTLQCLCVSALESSHKLTAYR